jgi:hypothetical protein
MVSLEAAARTGSLLLPPRAAKLIDRQDAEGLTALSALELQPTPLAADALLAAWRDRSHLGALRALARRRDPRIVDDCLLLLGDDEPAISQVGAETVRDLRHPSTTDSLLAALDVAPSDSVVAVVAHTLAMLQAPEAAPSLLVVAERVTNPQLADLLRRWAGQLVTGRAAPV